MENNSLVQNNRHLIAKSLIEAMRNHPPKKEDMLNVFENIKSAFPELVAFKGPIENLPDKIPEWLWETGHIYDLYYTVEGMLRDELFNDKKSMDAFAYLMWLSTTLLFENELRSLADASNRF